MLHYIQRMGKDNDTSFLAYFLKNTLNLGANHLIFFFGGGGGGFFEKQFPASQVLFKKNPAANGERKKYPASYSEGKKRCNIKNNSC